MKTADQYAELAEKELEEGTPTGRAKANVYAMLALVAATKEGE